MPDAIERASGDGAPFDFERGRRGPDEGFCPGGGIDGRGGRGRHAGVALERAAVVDGEEEDDVAARLVGFCQVVEILLLGRPGALWTRMLDLGIYEGGEVARREGSRWDAMRTRTWE